MEKALVWIGGWLLTSTILFFALVSCGGDGDDAYSRRTSGEYRCIINYVNSESDTVDGVTLVDYILRYKNRDGSMTYIVANGEIESVVCE